MVELGAYLVSDEKYLNEFGLSGLGLDLGAAAISCGERQPAWQGVAVAALGLMERGREGRGGGATAASAAACSAFADFAVYFCGFRFCDLLRCVLRMLLRLRLLLMLLLLLVLLRPLYSVCVAMGRAHGGCRNDRMGSDRKIVANQKPRCGSRSYIGEEGRRDGGQHQRSAVLTQANAAFLHARKVRDEKRVFQNI